MLSLCRETQRAQDRLCRGPLLITSRRPAPTRAPASLQPVESIHSSGARGTELVFVCEIGLPPWGSPEGNVRRAFSRTGWEGNESGAPVGGRREVQRPSPRAPDLRPRPRGLRGGCPWGAGRVIGSCRSSRGPGYPGPVAASGCRPLSPQLGSRGPMTWPRLEQPRRRRPRSRGLWWAAPSLEETAAGGGVRAAPFRSGPWLHRHCHGPAAPARRALPLGAAGLGRESGGVAAGPCTRPSLGSGETRLHTPPALGRETLGWRPREAREQRAPAASPFPEAKVGAPARLREPG